MRSRKSDNQEIAEYLDPERSLQSDWWFDKQYVGPCFTDPVHCELFLVPAVLKAELPGFRKITIQRDKDETRVFAYTPMPVLISTPIALSRVARSHQESCVEAFLRLIPFLRAERSNRIAKSN